VNRTFASREALHAYLREQFPEAPDAGEPSPIAGGRSAAMQQLSAMDAYRYGNTRNYLDGAVTRLSPYLRHGVLTLAEVRDFIYARFPARDRSYKLLQELAWRDYWQRLYERIGNDVWDDREPYKTGFDLSRYSTELPAAVRQGTTGLACMDAFARDLITTGYLHNHARMWMAAWIVHWLRVRWQAGAAWFLTHLLDGDPASNNLSWQWVASTFSHKPYFFNRENLERYTRGRYCENCPRRNDCPFDASYEELSRRLFPRAEVPVA
jgi:deoxyribodipyrimidine photo-lyase